MDRLVNSEGETPARRACPRSGVATSVRTASQPSRPAGGIATLSDRPPYLCHVRRNRLDHLEVWHRHLQQITPATSPRVLRTYARFLPSRTSASAKARCSPHRPSPTGDHHLVGVGYGALPVHVSPPEKCHSTSGRMCGISPVGRLSPRRMITGPSISAASSPAAKRLILSAISSAPTSR